MNKQLRKMIVGRFAILGARKSLKVLPCPPKNLLHMPYDIYQWTLKQKYFSGEFQPCNHGYWSKLGGICQNGRLPGKKMFHPTKIHT